MTALSRPIRTYAKHGGRPLSPHQKHLMQTRLPALQVPEDGPIDLKQLFPGASAIWLEIGFGSGEHLVAQAGRHPGIGFIGAEPFIDGVAKTLGAIDAAGLTNVRLWPGDARNIIERLPAGALQRVFILFPDPWPKRRQQKRRLVQPDFAQKLHAACAPHAEVRFATDVRSYADEALGVFLSGGRFTFCGESASDWRRPPADHFTTRYEQKRLGDMPPVWFDLRSQPNRL